MTEVGAFEAKTHLSALLDRAERGERFLITKHGRPVAELIPPRTKGDADGVLRAIADLAELRGELARVRPGRRRASDARARLRDLAHTGHRY